MISQTINFFISEKLAALTFKTQLNGITFQETNLQIHYHENTIPDREAQ